MAWTAFILYLTGIAVAFGLRGWLHARATGDSGHRHSRPPFGTAAWWGLVLLGAALLLGAIAPLLAATGVAPAPAAWTWRPAQLAGLVLAVLGFVGVVLAQQAMGRSWRVGVDPAERTELVTGGIFSSVRNPVFSAMALASVGLTLMVPSPPQLLALACLLAGFEAQVRGVEEPYLRAAHGDRYESYVARTGRFVPRLRSDG